MRANRLPQIIRQALPDTKFKSITLLEIPDEGALLSCIVIGSKFHHQVDVRFEDDDDVTDEFVNGILEQLAGLSQ